MRTLLLACLLATACGRPSSSASGRAAPADTAAKGTKVDGTAKTLAELFEGKFAGVTVISVPGGVKLRIRNAQNVDGSPGDPLYVIDGLPISPPDGILSINPNDVARIEILKDNASTAIWGERGANGVVKITTRRK
jgi:TonB-dependent SusC/RagA subfamily outer membrane receptor